MEGKEPYESWEKNETNGLVGTSYKLVGTKENISEILTIEPVESQLIYGATVLDHTTGHFFHLLPPILLKE